MKTAAIYCRVSSDNQEREGTSLETQLEACRNYCQDKGYDVRYRFSEAYSGLNLDRPQLNELRELVRNDRIEVVIIYCLDRLSRNATHGVIIRDELDKHRVVLESVTEDIDKTPLGEAITYLRGTFSQIEAEKIRERTMRGKKAKALQGKMSSGGFARLYGYDYIKVGHSNGGRRIINETETEWVRKVFHWLVDEGMSTSAITYRLRALGAPSKYGGLWCRAAVINILKNPAYTGRTYAFTTVDGKPYSKKREEWIEIPNVTPAIITEELLEAAQRQLQLNRKKASRNVRRQYLLRGHIHCRQCDRAFYGCVTQDRRRGERKLERRYRCSGKLRMVSPFDRCGNKSWQAERLEAVVWEQIERVLDNPELIITELEKQHKDVDKLGVLEAELQQIDRQLRTLDRDQKQLLQWALKGFPEETVVVENKRLNDKRTSLQAQKAELNTQLEASREAAINLPKLEQFIELVRQKLATLDFDTKRLALEMLNIKVWIDDYSVEVTGTLPVSDDVIVTTQS